MPDRPILLVDAFNLFHRHYVRHPGMSSQGTQAGGILGFLGSLKNLVQVVQPQQVIVVWEGGGSQRKRDIYPDYKAQRRPPRFNRYYEDDIPDTGENRIHQIRVLTQALPCVGVCQLFVEDCEADDVIGYLCRNKLKDRHKVIASSDRDFYQLLDDTTMQYSWTSKRFVGPADVITEMGISTTNFALAKAVSGDPSDNIPGVKGVGFKTLAKRFPEFGADVPITLNELLETSAARVDEGPKVFESITANADVIKRNLQLIYLDTRNLAAVQVRHIDGVVDAFKPARNKMQLMRLMIDEGLATFDSHELFSTFISL